MKTSQQPLQPSNDLADKVTSSMQHYGGPLFAKARLSDFSPALVEKVTSALLANRGLFIHGDPGRGKTHLLFAVLSLVLEKIIGSTGPWKSMVLRYENDMLLEIRRAFSPGSGTTEEEMLNQFTYSDVLLLDDLGVAKPSEWVISTMDTIIDHRYRSGKVIIITSNLSLAAVRQRLGERVASRLAAMCEIVHLAGPDRRLQRG